MESDTDTDEFNEFNELIASCERICEHVDNNITSLHNISEKIMVMHNGVLTDFGEVLEEFHAEAMKTSSSFSKMLLGIR